MLFDLVTRWWRGLWQTQTQSRLFLGPFSLIDFQILIDPVGNNLSNISSMDIWICRCNAAQDCQMDKLLSSNTDTANYLSQRQRFRCEV